MRENKLLLLDIDFTSRCNLNCIYCDRQDYLQDLKEKKKHPLEELTIDERKSIILEAKKLGCKTIEIPGAGEPLLDPHFWESIEFIREQDITPVVYTNGTLINRKIAHRLKSLGVSIVLKFNSLNHFTQDLLVGKNGYGEQVEKVLYLLMDEGFNKTTPTSLGVDIVITPINKKEIFPLFRFCRKNNIFPFCASLIPHGRAVKNNLAISKKEMLEIYKKARQIDKKEFGIKYRIQLPVIGGYVCRQINVGVFVNCLGKVYECNGMSYYLGNIREKALIEIWNSAFAREIRRNPQNGYCPVREEFWTNS